MKRLVILVLVVSMAVLFAIVDSQASSFVLTGNYLKVGISNSGGLIDDGFNCGIKYDPSGSGSFGVSDFIMPGSPFEFYSVGINGNWYSAGFTSGNPFGMVTTDTSSGTTLSARSVGTYGLLSLQQDVWFEQDSSIIHFYLTATNTSTTETLYNLAYARGLDPDQDADIYGLYTTLNSISDLDTVRAVGPRSGLFIEIQDIGEPGEGGGIPTINNYWDTDPYLLSIPRNDGNGDYTINLALAGGELGPGQSAYLEFIYSIGQGAVPPTIPEPATMSLLGMGLLGLVGLRRKRV